MYTQSTWKNSIGSTAVSSVSRNNQENPECKKIICIGEYNKKCKGDFKWTSQTGMKSSVLR